MKRDMKKNVKGKGGKMKYKGKNGELKLMGEINKCKRGKIEHERVRGVLLGILRTRKNMSSRGRI
jgi:hypothetical protein